MLSAVTYKSNWWGFIGKRLMIAAVAFFVISFMIFIVIHLDHEVYSYKFMGNITEPLIVQYIHWLEDFFKGNWGYSIIGDSFYSK
jgi:ABC-type dipeptide/oligopeptide/nickel transport system permease component